MANCKKCNNVIYPGLTVCPTCKNPIDENTHILMIEEMIFQNLQTFLGRESPRF